MGASHEINCRTAQLIVVQSHAGGRKESEMLIEKNVESSYASPETVHCHHLRDKMFSTVSNK